MRDALRPLEGQLVVYRARATERIERPGGLIDVCMCAVEVRRLTSEPLLRQDPIRLDHCWIKGMRADRVEWRGLLKRMAGCARVSFYARSNGTIDLGLQCEPGLDLDCLWDAINIEPDRAERVGRLRAAAKAVSEGGPYWSWTQDAEQVADALQRAVAKYDSEMALNIAAQMIAPANGPCRRMRAADPFAGLRRRSKKEAAA